jgi:ATP-dependent Lon protease
MNQLLPLFPLQLVAFPGSAIPLHIFEERYKQMVGEAEARSSEFGIVLAKDDGIANAGCTVVVEQILRRYPDGRFDLIARGQRRFEIVSLDQEKDYLRGEVEYFADEDAAPADAGLRQLAIEGLAKIRQALDESSERTPDPENPFLSFELAQGIEDLDFQNMVQRSRSESERLRMFANFAEKYIERRKYAEKMRRSAPQNGFGHLPARAS